MPRASQTDGPDVVDRHCTCERIEVDQQLLGELPRRIEMPGRVDPDCPLHSPDARFDLPEGL